MNNYNENKFCNNIINKYKKKISLKLSKSKSFSKYSEDNLIHNKIINKKKEITKTNIFKFNKNKKFIGLRNFSATNKSKLLCLKNPNKSDFIQNILNEIIPKNIRKPYGVKLGYDDDEFPKIYIKTDSNIKNLKNKTNKITFKKVPFLTKKIENVTNEYISTKKYKIKSMDYHGKLISNFLTPFNKFISHDFNMTNKEYNKIIKNIDNLNNTINKL